MRKLLFLGAAMFLAACASAIPGQTPVDRVFAAQADYNVVLAAAVAYTDLPRCEKPAAPAACSKAAVVAEIRKADVAVNAALKAAQGIVRTPGVTEGTASPYIAAVLHAIGALRTVLVTYGIT